MNLLMLLALAQTTRVAVRPDARTACPSRGQVQTALAARVPSSVVTFAPNPRSGVLVLDLMDTPNQEVRLSLVDAEGKVRLERLLTRGEGQDCSALAETAALMVERFLIEVDFHPPEPPSPPPAPVPDPLPKERRWDLSVAGSWRPLNQELGAVEVGGRIGWLFGPGHHLLLLLGAAVGGESNPVPAGSAYSGIARVRQVPIDLGLAWRARAGFAEVQVGPMVGFDLTLLRAHSLLDQETRILPCPEAGLFAAWRLPLGSRFFLRLATNALAGLVRYDFSYRPNETGPRTTVFEAPTRRIYAKLTLELGVSLQ